MAMATVSLAVGGLCPWFTANGDVISSQAYASKRDGALMCRTMNKGSSAAQALAAVQADDPDIAYRQLLILPRDGAPVAFTGDHCRPWAGHITGVDYVVAGNVLAGQHVIRAMADAFLSMNESDLGERLLGALEAGRDAGGQALPDRTGLAERSASLCVLDGGGERTLRSLDLRVDMHHSAVHELRRLFEVNRVYGVYADRRDRMPADTPSMVAFEAQALREGGIFASRPSCYR